LPNPAYPHETVLREIMLLLLTMLLLPSLLAFALRPYSRLQKARRHLV
jgi:hypothetical protein